MKTIHKYTLSKVAVNEIETYEGAVVLAAHEQDNAIVVHVLLDTRNQPMKAEFSVVPTGAPIMDHVKNPAIIHAETFVDTVIMKNELVWHVFSLTLPVAK